MIHVWPMNLVQKNQKKVIVRKETKIFNVLLLTDVELAILLPQREENVFQYINIQMLLLPNMGR
jgi:hypothetical protein